MILNQEHAPMQDWLAANQLVPGQPEVLNGQLRQLCACLSREATQQANVKLMSTNLRSPVSMNSFGDARDKCMRVGIAPSAVNTTVM